MNLISRTTFASDQDCALYNRIAWRILPFLFVLYVVAFLDRVNVGFSKLQKVGARLWITRIMVVWGLISTSMMFVSSPTSFYSLRVLLGVAEAGFYPGVVPYLTYWLPAYAQSQGLACLSLGLCIAMAGCLPAFNVLWAIPGTLLTGAATAAGIALMTTVGNFGGYASPFMMGWIKEASGHLEYGLYVLAALTFVAALVMSRVKPQGQPAMNGLPT